MGRDYFLPDDRDSRSAVGSRPAKPWGPSTSPSRWFVALSVGVAKVGVSRSPSPTRAGWP